MKKFLTIGLPLLLVTGAAIAVILSSAAFLDPKPARTLYGNIDDRQANLAFIIPERIAGIFVEEGDTVAQGQVLAKLETVRLLNDVAEAKASLAAAEETCRKIVNGPRKEDIDIARAALDGAEAALKTTRSDYERQSKLSHDSAVSIQTAEMAEGKYLIARAGVNAARRRLDKLLAGSRPEEIAEAKANVARQQARLSILRQRLADAELHAPNAGVIRNRLLEPGEIAAPERPVLTLAVTDPKWVRTYVPETMLCDVPNGAKAKVKVDSLPDKEFDGWVGFVSPNAEFTPKNVETPELRTALVYEVRIFVKDPANQLKLGAPATVRLP